MPGTAGKVGVRSSVAVVAARRPDLLEYGEDLAVRAAFDLSYARLSEAQRRMFRLLSLAPGRQVSRWTAKALAGLQIHNATRLLGAMQLMSPQSSQRARTCWQSAARHGPCTIVVSTPR
jgi:hypothetical protein